MEIFLEKLCLQLLQTVRVSSGHHLPPKLRIELYRALGTSSHASKLADSISQITQAENGTINFTYSDKVLGWLALLTAEKVLPIWKQVRVGLNGEQNELLWGNPSETIEIGKKVLQGNETVQNALSYVETLFYYPSSRGNAGSDDLKFYFCSRTACDALEFLLLGVEAILHTGALFYTDEEKSFAQHDFAAMAVTAYAGFEKNNSNKKRLEFWDWWLTEAVPDACELAKKSSNP